MASGRRVGAFEQGMGVEPEQHVCADCGYAHTNRKNFKRTDDGSAYTCSTGHYEDKSGNLKRQANFYARR